MTQRSWIVAVSLTIALTVCLAAQEKGGEDVTGPYDVVEDWLKPLPWHQGWTFGLVAGIFAESQDRIFVLQGGEPMPIQGVAGVARAVDRCRADRHPSGV